MNHDDQLILDFLAWLRGGNLAPSTLRLRRYTLGAFARRHAFATATTADVQCFLDDLPGGPWSRASHLAALRKFYRWAVLAGRLHHDPTLLVHAIHVPPGLPRPLPEHALAAAFAVADQPTTFALLLGSYAGLRRAEIAALHSADVSDTHLTIRGKGGVTRRVPVHPRLRPHLAFTGWAFPSPRLSGRHVHADTIAAMVTAVLGEPWTCHQLRHLYATRIYLASGHDILVTQRLLGHSSPSTTQRYVATGMDDDLAAVLAVA